MPQVFARKNGIIPKLSLKSSDILKKIYNLLKKKIIKPNSNPQYI